MGMYEIANLRMTVRLRLSPDPHSKGSILTIGLEPIFSKRTEFESAVSTNFTK